jgi:hypothetical protein
MPPPAMLHWFLEQDDDHDCSVSFTAALGAVQNCGCRLLLCFCSFAVLQGGGADEMFCFDVCFGTANDV